MIHIVYNITRIACRGAPLAERYDGAWMDKTALLPLWAFHLIFYKKTGKICMCVDYWNIKKNTRVDIYTIPPTDDLFGRLH